MITIPVISVIVAVKDESILLKRCIDDLLNQSFSPLEIIIVDDGSDLITKETIAAFTDSKIRVITLPQSVGQSAARNEGIRHAQGSFIAIADADDQYHPHRLEYQIDFMEINPSIHILGSGFHTSPENNEWPIYHSHEEIFHQMLINCPLVHSSLLFRKELFDHGLQYDSAFDTSEDYALYAGKRHDWIFHNLKDQLVTYTIGQKSEAVRTHQTSLARKIREKVLLDYLPNPTAQAIALHHDFCELKPGRNIQEINNWIENLTNAYKGNHAHTLQKILYRHAWQYASKHGSSSTFVASLKLLLRCRFSPASILKYGIRLLFKKPQ